MVLDWDADFGFYDDGDESEVDEGGSFFYDSELEAPHKSYCTASKDWQVILSVHSDAHIISTSGQGDGHDVQLKESIWSQLPEETLFVVLSWLPAAAQSRYRTVCSKWNAILSSQTTFLQNFRTAYTVFSDSRAPCVKAFCHVEYRWFNIPLPVIALEDDSAEDCHWKLADVDEGLFCYKRDAVDGDPDTRIAVCNPLVSSSALLLPYEPMITVYIEVIKLLVHRENNTFKVVVLMLGSTTIFDSATFTWNRFECFSSQTAPSHPSFFVWKGFVCIHNENDDCLFLLDMTQNRWTALDIHFPGNPWKKFAIAVFEDELLLVQLDLKIEEFISIWKLVNNDSEHGQPFSLEVSEKQLIVLPEAIKCIASDFRECVSYRKDYICFHGGRLNQWIKYVFSTRTWCLMPCQGQQISNYKWFDWEPAMNMNVKRPVEQKVVEQL